MTTYYVGPGGSDGNDGLSWANRFLTLNAAEDEPVVANDTVYVGPGIYRELLTCDVSGSSGQPITYIADSLGENTDGIGGYVRITGSNDEQTDSRAHCIYSDGKSYRTFRGFLFDFSSTALIEITNGIDNWIIEDCSFGQVLDDTDSGILIDEPSAGDIFTIRRCFFGAANGIEFYAASEVAVSSSVIIENCVKYKGARWASTFVNGGRGIISDNVVGFTVKNCTFIGTYIGVAQRAADTTGVITVKNCIFSGNSTGLRAETLGDIVEDYCALPRTNGIERSSVATGSNSNAYLPLFEPTVMKNGTRYPLTPWDLSRWSQLNLTHSDIRSDDFYGISRPLTSSKNSWGAIQQEKGEYDSTITRNSSPASIKITDASRVTLFAIVQGGVETEIEIYVRRDADYSGTLPQLIIREPGQSDRVTTDTGSAETFNELKDTFTPQNTTQWVLLILVSNNTATSGDYAVNFEDLYVQ